MFGLQHLWSPVLALNATNSWGEKKVVCNVKSSSHAFPIVSLHLFPLSSFLDSFLLPFRDEETLAHAQHKGWDDPVLEAMAAPGKVPEVVDAGAQKLAGDGWWRFFDAQNGEWIENGNFRNDEFWRRNEDTDDIGWKKSARLPEIRKLQSVNYAAHIRWQDRIQSLWHLRLEQRQGISARPATLVAVLARPETWVAHTPCSQIRSLRSLRRVNTILTIAGWRGWTEMDAQKWAPVFSQVNHGWVVQAPWFLLQCIAISYVSEDWRNRVLRLAAPAWTLAAL